MEVDNRLRDVDGKIGLLINVSYRAGGDRRDRLTWKDIVIDLREGAGLA